MKMTREEMEEIENMVKEIKEKCPKWKISYNKRKLKKLFKCLNLKLKITTDDLEDYVDGIIDENKITLNVLHSEIDSSIIFKSLHLLGYKIFYPNKKKILFNGNKEWFKTKIFVLELLFNRKDFDEFVYQHTNDKGQYNREQIEKDFGLNLNYFYKLLKYYGYYFQ
jgi:hypothetical protein